MILIAISPELVTQLLLSGWQRGETPDSFYWPGPIPRC